jgi:hypothetical protein
MSHLEKRFAGGSPKRILALDGGGVRGLISLGILEAIERELATRSGRSDLVLSDYFDLIAGTSTGSIIAVGLAMGMKVSDLTALYEKHTPAIFPKTRRKGVLVNKYDAGPLESLLADVVGDEPLESRKLKTGLMICAKRMDTDSAWVLTNNPAARYWDCNDDTFFPNRLYKLRMLVRASTAAPTFFAPVMIDISSGRTGLKKETGVFVDGAISGHNSPALQSVLTAILPAYGFGWQPGEDRLLVISVGTGWRRDRRDPEAFMKQNPMSQGIAALQGLINDTVKNDLMVLQALSNPGRAWPINSEVGGLEGAVIAPAPLFAFQRYDASLDESAVIEALGIQAMKPKKREPIIAALRDMVATSPSNLQACLALGRNAGRNVAASHFPAVFNDILFHDRARTVSAAREVPVSATLSPDGRLVSNHRLDREGFHHAARLLGATIGRYRKTARVAARASAERQTVITLWNGEETRNIAEPGDMLVTTLNPDGLPARDRDGQLNTYVITAARFDTLYRPVADPAHEPALGALFEARGEIEAFAAPSGFEIMAPWGEMERGARGYVVRNGEDVYGVAAEVFETTYAAVRD